MKKILGILVLGLILFIDTAEASKKTVFKKGQIYKGEIFWTSKKKLNLPPGKWEVVERDTWGLNAFSARGISFVQIDGQRVIATFTISEFIGNGKMIADVAQFVYGILFKDDFDGCYERSEYTLVKVYHKGMTVNCFIVQHSDVNKELYQPDDLRTKVFNTAFRKWIRDNNMEIPKIEICADGSYFAPVVRDTLFTWNYCIDPEVFGASKNKFTKENSSEYHPANINQYPDKKKFMDDWIKLSAQRHKAFELMVGAKERHKLDFSEYGSIEVIKETKTTSSNLTKELDKLNELYKSGALTKEEFTKAKKKLLN
jgi:hypothetical protein|tara:strand:- start:294 stop:1232 length:939 start_codon:yes stop_codon:yes gene_type:complete